MGVQHHHAHLAACLAEHGEPGPAVGAIFDGTGYGTDGTVWGGELLVGDPAASSAPDICTRSDARRGAGDHAALEDGLLLAAGDARQRAPLPPLLAEQVSEEDWSKVAELAGSGLASPVTSSAGRLFDAVAALCGIRAEVNYEGQAAVELEAAADPAVRESYPLPGTELLDARETVLAILADLGAGVPVADVAAKFHNAVAEGVARACAEHGRAEGIELAVLSGGVFQNRLLLERTAEALEGAGLRVLVPRLLPPNDGGVSFGQAAVAAAGAQRVSRSGQRAPA